MHGRVGGRAACPGIGTGAEAARWRKAIAQEMVEGGWGEGLGVTWEAGESTSLPDRRVPQ